MPRFPRLPDAALIALAGMVQSLSVLVPCALLVPGAVTPASAVLGLALGALGGPLGFAAVAWIARRTA